MSGIATAIVGSAVIGGVVSSKNSRRASDVAEAGGEREIAYNEETRDLIRKDQEPYRKAGYKALDALQSLVGLGTPGAATAAPGDTLGVLGFNGRRPLTFEQRFGGAAVRAYGGDSRHNIRRSAFSRASGGNTIEGDYYNINELGPESVYSGGEYTRTPNPRTISGTEGYVQPNIQGRALGGAMGTATMGAWGGPQQQLPMGVGGPYGGLPARPPATPVQPPPSDSVPGGGYAASRPTPGRPNIDRNAPPAQAVVDGNLWNNDTPISEVVGGFAGLRGGTSLHFGGYQGNLAEDRANPQVSNYIQDRSTTAINPQTGYPNENPGGEPGGYQFETDPGYQFRFSEGQRALDRGAASRGGLLSGGYARKAIRYGQGFASNEFTNVYNRIANIAGLGQTANQTNAQSALYTGAAMGNAASNAANASAYGQIQAGNAWANAGNQLAQLPWGNVFNRGTGPFAGNPGTPNDF